MLSKEFIEELRAAIVAEIQYQAAMNETGADGYGNSSHRERVLAERAWELLVKDRAKKQPANR